MFEKCIISDHNPTLSIMRGAVSLSIPTATDSKYERQRSLEYGRHGEGKGHLQFGLRSEIRHSFSVTPLTIVSACFVTKTVCIPVLTPVLLSFNSLGFQL